MTREEASAARLMEIVRGHWGIENGLHYRKDKTLREDGCRLRRGEAAQAMAVIANGYTQMKVIFNPVLSNSATRCAVAAAIAGNRTPVIAAGITAKRVTTSYGAL